MNETVLFLVIGAAVILVGLFLWSRMEAKKNDQSKVGLSKESRDEIYQRMTQIRPPMRENNQKDLVSQLKGDEALSESSFDVVDVKDHDVPAASEIQLKPAQNQTPMKRLKNRLISTRPPSRQKSLNQQRKIKKNPLLRRRLSRKKAWHGLSTMK